MCRSDGKMDFDSRYISAISVLHRKFAFAWPLSLIFSHVLIQFSCMLKPTLYTLVSVAMILGAHCMSSYISYIKNQEEGQNELLCH